MLPPAVLAAPVPALFAPVWWLADPCGAESHSAAGRTGPWARR
ncbi:hypothetical protein ACIQ6K_00680 [Streptomyces sp. NPDC096354]